jgi:hypothetical protein
VDLSGAQTHGGDPWVLWSDRGRTVLYNVLFCTVYIIHVNVQA